MKINRIHALAFACGFISLCIEMFWVRYLGFAWQGDPYAFGFVLSAFLVGIAFGAWYGKILCEQLDVFDKLLRRSAWWLLLSGVLVLLAPVLAFGDIFIGLERLIIFILIACTSFCLSVMFPVVHHLGVQQASLYDQTNAQSSMGRHFSGVYCANVAGAALGPLFFGYVLLNFLTTQQALFSIAGLSLGAALVYLYLSSWKGVKLAALSVVSLAGLILGVTALPADWLIQRANSKPEQVISSIHETRQGIITIYEQPKLGDVVMGGNIYDGTTNVSLEINSNGLDRPLLMSVLHEQPKRVLMVGLSIGSWLALVREFPGVEHIDVVEINPGYLKALQPYPAQKAAIADPRVKLHIHDARRWIKLHPENRYDLIFMNTTFHWRSNATLLLSREYLSLLKGHMNPGAVLAFNATGSLDALRTAADVFPFARRYTNFVYAAQWDFTAKPQQPQALSRYQNFKMNGQPAFAPNSKQPERFLGTPFVDVQQASRMAGRPAEVITDWNMISEYRYGRAP